MGEAGEGIGDILTGGLVAREVDRAGGAADHDPHEGAGGTCLNCGAVRAGPYCQQCGQTGHLHRNLAALGHDILHGVFHFEGRIWHTLPLLALHPGRLTRRYVHGERVKFVSPMALFLFSVFLLFAAVNRLPTPDVKNAVTTEAGTKISDAAGKERDELASLQEKRTERLADNPGADVRQLDADIRQAQSDVDALDKLSKQLPALNPVTDRSTLESIGNAVANGQIAHIRDNPALYAYKLKTASYKFSWALIPISVPFIWLMFFWRRDVGLYDHAIFAIHSLSFMTLFVVALIGLYLAGVSQAPLWLALLIVPPIHMFRHLKDAYILGRFGALWRTVTLLSMTGVASLLFFLLLLWLEAE